MRLRWLALLLVLVPRPVQAGFCTACARPRFLAQGDRHPLSVALPLVYAQTHAGSGDEATVTVLELDSAWSLSLHPKFALELILPVRLRTVDGEAAGVRSEQRLGIGDSQVTGRYRLLELQTGDPLDLDLRAGVALPFGGTTASPQVDLQYVPFGQQVLQLVVGAQATLQLDGARLLGFGWAKVPLYESGPGFQAGWRASMGAAYLFDFPSFGLEVGGGVYLERADRWRDGTLVPTTGHQDVFVRLGLRLFQDTAWPTELAAVLPVVLNSEGPATIHSPGTFSLSVARDFAL